jgi:isocitrate dehydrogenase (NAD+)
MSKSQVEEAKEKFEIIIEEQLKRIEAMKQGSEAVDYSKINPIIIGVCFGDGIGEIISKHAQYALEHVLKDEVAAGKVQFKDIAGLTI